jgi:hypothetical protein
LVLVGCGGDVVITVYDNVDATEVSEVSVDSFVATESAVDASDAEADETETPNTCGIQGESCEAGTCCLGYHCDESLDVCYQNVVLYGVL